MAGDDVREPERSERWDLSEGDEVVPGRTALQSLGGGWDYEVYLGWDDHLHSLVVIKLVRPHLVHDDHTLRSLARESGLLDRLAHPVVVRGFDAVLDGDRPHLVLEHLEGPTLSRTVRKTGPLELHQLVPLAYQLASGLQYLANERVVHLDVKPGNVILGAPPRLIDLSIARTVEDAARLRSPVGTDAYMAPEQCDPALAEVGAAADVWGFGATLYEAVSGVPPFPRPDGFDRQDPRQRFPQILGEPPRPLTEQPPELGALVAACLSFAPGERPSAGEAADRLEPLIGAMRRGRVLGRSRPRLR
ncbi:MAG TPA: serine/threonine-protein kinase [Actinomycetota bacterium]